MGKKGRDYAVVFEDKCIGCEICISVCNVGANSSYLVNGNSKAKSDPLKCNACSNCIDSCEIGARTSESHPPKTLPEIEEWINQAARFYRSIGFLHNLKNISDSELVKYLISNSDKNFQPWNYFDDMLWINSFNDNSLIWYRDAEYGVGRGNNCYVKVLQEWAAISRGCFFPEEITESWDTDDGLIKVEFVLEGKTKYIYPNYCRDYLDLSILTKINDMIRSTGYNFEQVFTGDQCACIILLTQEQKEKLYIRGWEFCQTIG